MTRTTAETHARIQRELAQEKAAALGRAGERLEAAIAELHRLGAAIDAARDARACATLQGEYDRARGRALAARLDLVIQREAVGLRRHAVVDQQFPVPPHREPRRP